MATKLSKARPAKFPTGLLTAGRSLWKSVVDEYELDTHESLLLLQACRTADRLDSMAAELATTPLTLTNFRGDEVAHPLLTESRQQSLALSRLVASLRLPSGDERPGPKRRGASRASYGVRSVS